MVSQQFWLKILKIFLYLFFHEKGLEMAFGCVLDRKQTFLNYQNIDFTQSPKLFFPKGLVHYCGQKNWAKYKNAGSDVIIGYVLERKQAFLDYQNIDLHSHQIGIFVRG